MNNRRHYSSFAKKPVPGTVFEFHVAATEICDEEPMLSIGWSPVPDSEDMSPQVRSFWKRHNPLLVLIGKQIEDEAVAKLAAAGVPASKLTPPFSPEVEALVADYVRGARHGFLLKDETFKRPPATRSDLSPLPPHHRVIVGAWLGRGGSTKAAEALNGGLPTGVQGGLDRNHIDRVMHAFKRLPGRTKIVLQAEILLCSTSFLGLERVRLDASRRPEFKGIRGRELAEAIHESRDLWSVMDRAVSTIPRSQIPNVA
ncbi:hypothetical protein [Methylobacterium sp. Leaf117]|uniref:hypothetical protein n=1 Tax=Methylobacterium sp. Leaf117 TaxID=1736260 RepID=UPI0007002E63|nr:hypothetical protein [Methylobacterium sp. Leaf117]KQP82957.1 hypothetical protein ASF57_12620 [Methylobacterium sp. Leaf117]